MVNRDLRLRSDWEVRQARARGKAYTAGPVVVRIFPNETDPPVNRYAVVAGKRVGKSHERNRCKRLVREAIRSLHPRLKRGFDVVVIVRGGVAELTGFEVAVDSLERIAQNARLLLPSAPAECSE